jgi:hypothetical protein
MGSTGEERLVRIEAGSVLLEGNLSLPEGARGIVLFAHGSGSSRFSPAIAMWRNCSIRQGSRHYWSTC